MDWSYHPILEIPSEEEQMAMGATRLLEYWEARESAIEREQEDPYRFGTELPHWKEADKHLAEVGELLILGGNRSSKSEFSAKRVVQTLVENPGSIVWCFTATSQNSIAHQQALIHKYLPNEFKELGRSRTHYISYSIKNGYTSNGFILPNKSQCVFRNWSQSIETIEGGEVGCPGDPAPGSHNIGIWFDEEVPLNYLNTGRYRCLTRANSDGTPARIITTFTTVSGWTSTVSSFLSGARTLVDKEAELLPGEKVPVLQQPLRTGCRVYYFHTADNPYGGWNAMKSQLNGAPRDEILCRAYGVPTKPSNTVFKHLDDRVIMKASEIPVTKDPDNHPASWILSIDPAGNKSWFMLLVAVSANGVHYVMDEWPGPDIGQWADMEKGARGVPGDGAMPNGFGIEDYAKVIKEMTRGKEDVDIIIDPRMGSATYAKEQGTSNIISDLADFEVYASPASGIHIDDGLQAINSLLSYDNNEPIGFNNHSRLIFSDKCGNTIFCCMNYRVEDGGKGVCKDPVDCLRYIAVGNYEYLEDSSFRTTGAGSY